jgi:hypothetical protein
MRSDPVFGAMTRVSNRFLLQPMKIWSNPSLETER